MEAGVVNDGTFRGGDFTDRVSISFCTPCVLGTPSFNESRLNRTDSILGTYNTRLATVPTSLARTGGVITGNSSFGNAGLASVGTSDSDGITTFVGRIIRLYGTMGTPVDTGPSLTRTTC